MLVFFYLFFNITEGNTLNQNELIIFIQDNSEEDDFTGGVSEEIIKKTENQWKRQAGTLRLPFFHSFVCI
ncbi:hypothetical protein COL30_20815 [Bacillus pseudomycoides]|nr:hypothetical protein COO19_28560 [Bacillus pseudomycoides]PEI84367.1 hypothetical protein CN686_28545 [Bacillus pseudomycoides]PEK11752.1 hypothetical protein CN693_25935 [Bacillus pseudomycoides]PEM61895.1 hypothetical protein CN619_29840 [Bacillus pseudomycoides]PEO10885.1 hypothetical protein CN542_22395 [Bacillus pseudomycoides]